MSRNTAASAVVVFLLAAGLGWFLSRDSVRTESASSTTTITSTTSAPQPAHFVDRHEAVIGPAVVVARDLRLDGTEVSLDFDIVELAPVGDAATVTRFLGFGSIEEVAPQDLQTVFADQWTLLTADGDIAGRVATPEARTARFDVGDGFSIETVNGARLDSFALLVPVDVEISLTQDNESAPVAPGVTARLLAVTEQAGTIIQVELISERQFNSDNVTVAGVGPGWKSAVREAEGRPRWNLTYDFPEAPSPIRLRVHGAVWMTLDSGIEVPLDGIQ